MEREGIRVGCSDETSSSFDTVEGVCYSFIRSVCRHFLYEERERLDACDLLYLTILRNRKDSQDFVSLFFVQKS